MESQLNKIEGVNRASIDFMSKSLIIEVNNSKEFNRILDEAKAIIKNIEPQIGRASCREKV